MFSNPTPAPLPFLDIDREIAKILPREGLWRDIPPDPPTMRGMSLPLWNEWCLATGQTYRTGKHALKFSTEADAFAFFRWYFAHKGLTELIREFSIPSELVPVVMDLRTQHSMEGCKTILRKARALSEGNTQEALIAVSRICYLASLVNGPQRHLRPDFRGMVERALRAVGIWP